MINSFAKALEIIPRTLSDNTGMDSTDVLNRLRQKHAQIENNEGLWYGVDVINTQVSDMFEQFVWEPQAVRINIMIAATEAACTILSID